MIKTVPIEALTPGMMVTNVIEQNGPVKIRKVGIIRSVDMVKGLKEMGVKTVEVDFSQSIEIDITNQNSSKTDATDTSLKKEKVESHYSATKKLIVSKEHQTNSERSVAQPQHSSLFVPAMEETRLALGLYSHPYITLCCLVIVGSLMGWGGSMAFFEYSGYRDAISAQLLSNDNSLPIKTAREGESSQDERFSSQTVEPESNNSNDNAMSTAKTTSREPSDDNIAIANNVSNDFALGSDEQTEPLNTMQVDVESSMDTNQETQSGLTLEDGQVVLGYRAEQELEDVALNPKNANNTFIKPTSQPVSSDKEEPLNQDLLQRIKDAAEVVDNRSPDEFDNVLSVTDLTALPRIDQLPQTVLAQMPSMSFSAHMYASNPQDRWVRVNSRRVSEGEFISNNLILKKIEAEQVVLDFRGTEFTMNALSDW